MFIGLCLRTTLVEVLESPFGKRGESLERFDFENEVLYHLRNTISPAVTRINESVDRFSFKCFYKGS